MIATVDRLSVEVDEPWRQEREGFASTDMSGYDHRISIRRVAILLIGVIAGIYLLVVPALNMLGRDPGISATRSRIQCLSAALYLYHMDFRAYPPDTTSLDGCTPEYQTSEALVYYLSTNFTVNGRRYGPYVDCSSDMLGDADGDGHPEFIDQWNSPIMYAENASHTRPTGRNPRSFDIVSAGADRRLGGTISPVTGYLSASGPVGRQCEADNIANFEFDAAKTRAEKARSHPSGPNTGRLKDAFRPSRHFRILTSIRHDRLPERQDATPSTESGTASGTVRTWPSDDRAQPCPEGDRAVLCSSCVPCADE